MVFDPSSNVTVKYKDVSQRKLAAGMSVKFIVEYTPSIVTDNFHKIYFSTDDNESFVVPIIGLYPFLFIIINFTRTF